MASTFSRMFLGGSAIMAIAALSSGGLRSQPTDAEPIAYIGHGAFFDAKGQEIAFTPEFVERAQNWYLQKLAQKLRVRWNVDMPTRRSA